MCISFKVAGSLLTSSVLGSNGESEGRKRRGLSSGIGFGGAGVETEQGKGGPSLGNVPPDGDFFIDGSFFGAIFYFRYYIPVLLGILYCGFVPR